MRLFLLSLLLATGASAQTGRLVGTVTELETGEPLVGANVWFVDTHTGAATDGAGRFSVDAATGTYRALVSYAGNRPVEHVVQIEAERVTRLDVALEADVLCECVITFDEPDLVSRGIYQARVVSYVVWETSCCTAWQEWRVAPIQRGEGR